MPGREDGIGFFRRAGRLADRLQPRTLRGRLTMATMVLSLVLVVVCFEVTLYAAASQLDRLSQSAAAEHLEGFRAFLDLEASALDSDAARLAASDTLYDRASARVGTGWAETALPAAGPADESIVVWTRPSGEVAYSRGSPADVPALRKLAAAAAGGESRGLVRLSSDTWIACCRPVVGSRGGAPRGAVVVARRLGISLLGRFLPMNADLRIRLLAPVSPPPAAGPDGEVVRAGFRSVDTHVRQGAYITRADMPGPLGSAGILEMSFDDPHVRASLEAARGAALAVAVFAGILGATFGLALAQTIHVPLLRTARRMRDQWSRTLEGQPWDPLGSGEAFSPAEFHELWEVVDGLLTALSERQAELREASTQAQNAEETLRVAVNDSPEAKMLLHGGVITLANPAATAVLGIPAEELLGRSAADVFAETDFYDERGEPLAWGDLGRVVEAPLVVRHVRRGQTDRWLRILAIPHPDEGVDRVLLTGRDITEERRLEALREEIVSMISHDLRAPLSVINGYLDILRRPLHDDARERALDSAKLNARKMTALLDDLLNATRAEQLLAPQQMQPLSLAVLAAETVESYALAETAHSIELVAEADPWALGDEIRLRQAVANLVTNAFKYSPAGTRVTVRVARRGALALLAVEDEGPGIPAEARESVFGRYSRIEETSKGKPGVGLGLYIVRVIAENHGGSVVVEDAPGGGARFVIELPVAAAPFA